MTQTCMTRKIALHSISAQVLNFHVLEGKLVPDPVPLPSQKAYGAAPWPGVRRDI